MPQFETYDAASASQGDGSDKVIISIDGVVRSISVEEMRKLSNTTEENPQTGTTYTLLTTDQNKVVRMTHASPKTVIIPSTSGFVLGVPIMVRNASAADITISPATGVTVNSESLVIGENVGYALVPIDADTWDIYT
jgi:hypothetical protein